MKRRGRPIGINLRNLPPFSINIHTETDIYISRAIEDTGVWEGFETRVIVELLAYFGQFIDIGANIGWYSVLAGHALAGKGHVLSFEPDPRNFELLEHNVHANHLHNVKLFNVALADTKGERILYRSADNLGDHRLYAEGSEGREAVRVATTTFNAAVSPHLQGPCLVKMDTQGSETMILEGMSDYLHANSKNVVLIIEFWPYGLKNAGTSAAALIDKLSRLNMNVWLVDEVLCTVKATTFEELIERAQSDLAPQTQGFANLLLIPSGHPAQRVVESLCV